MILTLRHIVILALSVFSPVWAYAVDIHISAAASLTNVLQDLARTYEKKSGNTLIFNFAGSNILARQIKEGAPADIFISADELQMDTLDKAGLIDLDSRNDLLSNTLVIVVPEDGPASLPPQALTTSSIRHLALADPQSVPAGIYAKAYLTKIGLWSAVKEKIIPTENVRAALSAVEYKNVEAGIVYKTDAGISQSVKIAYEVPLSDGPKILYPMALVTRAPQAKAARNFIAFLKSHEAAIVFKKAGFLPMSP